jgi:dihydroflavonol-4-reductase
MIVVTGGTGLLGAHLLLELAKEDAPVRVILREGTSPEKVLSVWKYYHENPRSLLERFEWHYADLTNRADVHEALDGAVQLYHCSGLVSFDPRLRRRLWEINFSITRNLVDECLSLQGIRMVHVSSVAAIKGSDSGEVNSESDGWPVKSSSVYARTKTAGEMEVWRGITEGMEAVIVNPSVILGPGNWKSSSARIVDVVYNRLPFYTSGVTGFVDARDVASAMLVLMKSTISGERYILNAANVSFRELFEKMAASLQRKAPAHYASPFLTSLAWRAERIKSFLTRNEPVITRSSARSAHAKQAFSSDKIKKDTGFTFREIDETIREVAACYLKEK